MRRPPLRTFLLPVIAGCLVASCDPTFSPDTAKAFRAELSGANVFPTAVTTSAAGTVTLVATDTSVTYTVKATNLTGTTVVHLHEGGSAGTGPILVTLIPNGSAPP